MSAEETEKSAIQQLRMNAQAQMLHGDMGLVAQALLELSDRVETLIGFQTPTKDSAVMLGGKSPEKKLSMRLREMSKAVGHHPDDRNTWGRAADMLDSLEAALIGLMNFATVRANGTYKFGDAQESAIHKAISEALTALGHKAISESVRNQESQ
jgi:hypothetical protein